MARFDVFSRPGRGGGYVLDVQADLLRDLETRVVVPLSPSGQAPRPARGLNPLFEIRGERLVMLTQFLAAVPAGELKDFVVSLDDRGDDILRALDVLLVGL